MELSEKFCNWCLAEKSGERRKHYEIWRKDRKGRRICRKCYEILRMREKAVGIVHITARARLKDSIMKMKDALTL